MEKLRIFFSKTNNIKYSIDAGLLIMIGSLAITGFILGFITPPGRPEHKFFLGLHRHQWGDIHFNVSLVIIALLCFHLFYNWQWICNCSKRIFGQHWQKKIIVIPFAWIFVIFLFWLIEWM